MFPIIGHLGPLTIYSFGLMLATAVLLCTYLLGRDAKAVGLSKETVYDFVFWLIVGGIVGARVFFIALNWSDFFADPRQIFMIQNGGLAWQGGLVVGGLSGLAFIRRKQLSVGIMADLAAPYLALGQAIGRVGCFLNGCCYGKEVSWGVYFPVHHAHLHPTQLYDTVLLTTVFFILKGIQKRSRVQGEIFALYLMLAAVERFVNEFFRADHVNTAIGLSVFQIVSLFILAMGYGFWWFLHRRAKSV